MRKTSLPVSTVLLALAAIANQGLAAGEAPTTGDQGTLTPDQEAALRAIGDGPTSKAAVAAEAKYTQALALYRSAQFTAALEAVEEAINAYPPHERAQVLRQDLLAVLSQRDNRLQMVTTWLHQIQDVKTQEAAVRMAALIEAGDKKMAAGDYQGAELDFDRVDVALRTFPYQFDWGTLPDQIAAKRLEARASSRRQELSERSKDRAAAQVKAETLANLQEDALHAKVDELLRRAKEAYKRKDYKRAEFDAWEAYQLDRRRDDARDLYLAARRKGHAQFDGEYREAKLELNARVHEEIHRALIPQSDLLVYPEDWRKRSLRQPQELGSSKVEPWMATIQDRLQQQVTFEFEDTSLEDVVNFFRQVTGVNIIVAPEVYASGSATVTLRARDMKFGDALKWVLELTNLFMAVQNQAIYISNEAVTGATLLRVYDVADLISPVRDFPGRELAYNSGSGGGGGGFDLFSGPAMEDGEAADPQDLVDFIQNNVAPGQWEGEGVAIEARTGSSLFISQAPEVHALVDQLLINMRNQRSLQVHMTVRVLEVRKNFFEEIGVEYHNSPAGLLNLGPGGPTASGTGTSGYTRVNEQNAFFGSTYYDMASAVPNQQAYSAGGPPGYSRGLHGEYAWKLGNFLGTDQINAVLSAVEEESDSQILQAPRITAFNGQRAHCAFMNQYAYISDYTVVNDNLDPTIEVLTYGDILDVRPVVSSDRKYITMEIRPSSVVLQGVFVELIAAPRVVGGGGDGGVVILGLPYPIELPNVVVRTLRSTVMLPDKATLLIGGFTTSTRQRTHMGIPFLSHIPFLGRLFSRNGIYDANRRLFFLLNAEIVDLAEKEALQ
ncbi:MAG TPA: hypothetical protein VEL07_15005 [Planctomycetota bacterium]|nr:hypothetical protein [Planctomycetota bacterium]